MKIVVFDLDETLGYFVQWGIFWDCLHRYLLKNNKDPLTQQEFNHILDLYPEFLRPNIMEIITYLKQKKESKHCSKIMIYTNNQGSPEWAHQLKKYFEYKNKDLLFDQIITAFKIHGKRIEICRSTHDKTYQDLLHCTKLPMDAEICFIDDTFYPDMANDNVYYINIKPYYYDLDFEYMIKKLKDSKIGKKLINNDSNFETNLMEYIKLYNYDCLKKNLKEYEIDKILGKHVIMHLKEFFKTKKNKSIRKKPSSKNNKTKKNN
jgi:FMN phosphatase YigB (HAD superfamily)